MVNRRQGKEEVCAWQSGPVSCQAQESWRESQKGTGTVTEPRKLKSGDPNHIPARGETKVFPLLLQSLVAVEDVLSDSSYASCGESSSLKKKNQVKLRSQQYL